MQPELGICYTAFTFLFLTQRYTATLDRKNITEFGCLPICGRGRSSSNAFRQGRDLDNWATWNCRKGVLSSGIRRDKSVAVVASTRDEITRSPTLTSTRRIASHCSSSAIERETGDSVCGSPRKSSTKGGYFFHCAWQSGSIPHF